MSDLYLKKYSLYEHYNDLKIRLLYVVIKFFFMFALSYYNSDIIMNYFILPLANIIPNHKMIFTTLPEGFMSHVSLSLYMSCFLIFPFFILQIFLFIKPGLYKYEIRKVGFLLLLSVILFYFGVLLVFFYIMPKALSFFLSFERYETSIPIILEAKLSDYISLGTHFMLVFGLLFQSPVVIIGLYMFDFISLSSLRQKRKIVIVVAFILGGVFTPPDIFSQVALALPIIILYELSLLYCKVFLTQTKKRDYVRY